MDAPVIFTLQELWLLNDFVRHDEEKGDERERARYPTVSTPLNEEIALALNACHEHGLAEYTLTLAYADILLIDHQIRRDYKTMEGANGKAILLKVYKARAVMSNRLLAKWPTSEPIEDKSYRKEVQRAAASDDPDEGADPHPVA